jgi:hypothetical protein
MRSPNRRIAILVSCQEYCSAPLPFDSQGRLVASSQLCFNVTNCAQIFVHQARSPASFCSLSFPCSIFVQGPGSWATRKRYKKQEFKGQLARLTAFICTCLIFPGRAICKSRYLSYLLCCVPPGPPFLTSQCWLCHQSLF